MIKFDENIILWKLRFNYFKNNLFFNVFFLFIYLLNMFSEIFRKRMTIYEYSIQVFFFYNKLSIHLYMFFLFFNTYYI